MGENPQQITQFLDALFRDGPVWVYLILVAACFIENIFPPFPGDSFIVAAGSLVAVSRLDLYLTFALAVGGGVSSVMLLHYFGRKYGRDFFLRRNFKYFSATDIMKVEGHLKKWGAAILIGSRFVVGLRAAIAVTAGIGRYQTVKMLVYSTISYIIFVGLLMYMSMALVENFERITYYFKTYNSIVWPTLIALVITYFVHRFYRLHKKV
jgi:membrane protein DedA with SNARE-associated domain